MLDLKREAFFWPRAVWNRPENLSSQLPDTCLFTEDHQWLATSGCYTLEEELMNLHYLLAFTQRPKGFILPCALIICRFFGCNFKFKAKLQESYKEVSCPLCPGSSVVGCWFCPIGSTSLSVFSFGLCGSQAVVYCSVTSYQKYRGWKRRKFLISHSVGGSTGTTQLGSLLQSHKDDLHMSAGLPSWSLWGRTHFQGHSGLGRIQFLALVGLRSLPHSLAAG